MLVVVLALVVGMFLLLSGQEACGGTRIRPGGVCRCGQCCQGCR